MLLNNHLYSKNYGRTGDLQLCNLVEQLFCSIAHIEISGKQDGAAVGCTIKKRRFSKV